MMQALRKTLQDTWRQVRDRPIGELLHTRFERLMGYGKFKEVAAK